MSAPSHPRPLLVLNPADDADFRVLVRGLVTDGAGTPSALEQGLRDRYPRVLVRPRALSGEPAETWYVYRDGRWVGSRG